MVGAADDRGGRFTVALDARCGPNDDTLETTGLTQAVLTQAEHCREEIRTGAPERVFSSLVNCQPDRAQQVIGGLGTVSRAIEAGREQLAADLFQSPWSQDRDSEDRDELREAHRQWWSTHLSRKEAALLAEWRDPVLRAWKAAGARL